MAGIKVKLTQRTAEAAKPEARRYHITDTDLPGFRLHVLPSGRKGWYLAYRLGGGRGASQREPKIGDFPAMKAEAARRIAEGWLADVRKGGDPAGERKARREAPRMNDLFDRYLEDHARRHKKVSSVENDVRMIEKRLRPAFGRLKVAELARPEIAAFHKRLAETPYEANRALALLSKMLNLAEIWDMRPDGSNPCRHVRKYAETQRKRFLSNVELARLGNALRLAERDGFLELPAKEGVREKPARAPVSAEAVAAIRLLILTGARKSEILKLRWEWIDFEGRRANLPDSKTGDKSIVLGPAALEVLAGLQRTEGNPHVIRGAKPGAHLVNLKDPWLAVREAAGLDDARIHDLRHSYASVGAAGGASLPIIGALLGHTQAQTTQRYAHLSDDPMQAAAAKISGQIASVMHSGVSILAGDGRSNRQE
ncbi:tyrosine-type recombinase/integrase [Albimonas sp. CAU 1670]|uniref:tyrosine-type recombinase/integrase n=1 Tax=Albimonas sp. CAU 1670 TaxID=3032599 RepID=UPI0023D9AC17|nr:site-specific integrase [Albimonas sp. CAU 1670]MDF2234964.1 tyrosine-type recombinase/integrase [Albimonas sp. CAU 1670]